MVDEVAEMLVGFEVANEPKLAVIFISEFKVTVSGFDEPEASPDQPMKVPPLLAVAVRVTLVPVAKSAVIMEEAVFIPTGELTIFPLYPPDAVVATVRFDAFIPPLMEALKSSVVP